MWLEIHGEIFSEKLYSNLTILLFFISRPGLLKLKNIFAVAYKWHTQRT